MEPASFGCHVNEVAVVSVRLCLTSETDYVIGPLLSVFGFSQFGCFVTGRSLLSVLGFARLDILLQALCVVSVGLCLIWRSCDSITAVSVQIASFGCRVTGSLMSVSS